MIRSAVDTARPITLMAMSVTSIVTMIIKGILPIPIHFCLPDISFYITVLIKKSITKYIVLLH